MNQETILIRTECDVRRLPLDASEAFLLSQIDGKLTLEEVGEAVGFDFAKAAKLADRLVVLGAVKPLPAENKAPPKSTDKRDKRDERGETDKSDKSDDKGRKDASAPPSSRRFDPRAELESVAPPRMEPRLDARAEAVDRTRPREAPQPREEPKREEPKPSPAASRPQQPQQKRRSTRSMRAVRAAAPAASSVPTPSPAAADTLTCELDAETQQKIIAMNAKIGKIDHYAFLGVERDTEKKEIKRAYFALASQFHPDRFFGKKLGPLRGPLDRVMIALTDANDALSTNARRQAYDATLPAAPAKPAAASASPQPPPSTASTPSTPDGPPRRMSRRLRQSSAKMKAAVAAKPPEKTEDKPPVAVAPPPSVLAAAPSAVPEPPPESSPLSQTGSNEKFRRLQDAAKMMAAQTRAEPLVLAAEQAIKAGDIVGAANNFRLALQIYEDPGTRRKLDAIDAHSRDLRHEKNIVRARLAERAERWSEAADFYARANDARKDPVSAERAAYALRLSSGDLRLAAQLAEQAVAHDGKNAEYRITLGEIYLTSNQVVRAKAESDIAISLAPNNTRAKTLAEAIVKRG